MKLMFFEALPRVNDGKSENGAKGHERYETVN